MGEVHCIYATASTEAEGYSVHRGWEKIKDPPRNLCAWAHFHPDAPAKLVDTPPWLQRSVLAGHLMRDGDCDICPAFTRGKAVE